MNHANHYEAAFAALLARHRVWHLAIDDARRGAVDGMPIKNLDFVVAPRSGRLWLVDVKGRRYPGGTASKPKRHFENWTTRDDVTAGLEWARRHGPDHEALLVFAYWLTDPETAAPPEATLWHWEGRWYGLRAIPMADYARQMRTRSPKWNTVCLPSAWFRQQARPLHEYWPEIAPAAAPEPESVFA